LQTNIAIEFKLSFIGIVMQNARRLQTKEDTCELTRSVFSVYAKFLLWVWSFPRRSKSQEAQLRNLDENYFDAIQASRDHGALARPTTAEAETLLSA